MSGDRASRRRLFFGVLIVGVFAMAELGAWGAAGFLSQDPRFDLTRIADRHAEMQQKLEEMIGAQGKALVELDSELGWTYRANYRGELYSSNAMAARGTRSYAAGTPPGTFRVAAFGDSFTHANEVRDDEAWSARLEHLDGRLEVLNFGVGGYGTDQAMMLYERRGEEFEADLVVLGFAEPDYARNVNRFRRFMTVHELPLFKPRFLLGDRGTLELLPNPMRDEADLRALIDEPAGVLAAAEHDWFFDVLEWRNPLYDHSMFVRLVSSLAGRAWRSSIRPDRLYRDGLMNPDSEALAVQVALVKRFQSAVEADGRRFVLMIFPGSDSDIWSDAPPTYAPMLEALPEVDVLDLADALRESTEVDPTNLRAQVHYSAIANAVVATAVHRHLADRGLLERAAVGR